MYVYLYIAQWCIVLVLHLYYSPLYHDFCQSKMHDWLVNHHEIHWLADEPPEKRTMIHPMKYIVADILMVAYYIWIRTKLSRSFPWNLMKSHEKSWYFLDRLVAQEPPGENLSGTVGHRSGPLRGHDADTADTEPGRWWKTPGGWWEKMVSSGVFIVMEGPQNRWFVVENQKSQTFCPCFFVWRKK